MAAPNLNGDWPPRLAVALSPAATVGTALDSGTSEALVVLEILAGYVSDGMTRAQLQDLGSALDAGASALVVVSPSSCAEGAGSLLERYGRVAIGSTSFDADDLKHDVREAERYSRRASVE